MLVTVEICLKQILDNNFNYNTNTKCLHFSEKLTDYPRGQNIATEIIMTHFENWKIAK
jgi:hypothetical protein